MDKVQKHNSFSTNTPSSESYTNYLHLYPVSSLDSKPGQLLRIRMIEGTLKKVLKRIFRTKENFMNRIMEKIT
jgi:hypothetical protein